jgi:hypothetical protein
MAVAPAIPDADHRSVRSADTSGTLDLKKEELHRVIDPGDFQAAPLQHTGGLDLGPAEPAAVADLGRNAVDRVAKPAVRVRDPSSSGSKYPVNSAVWSPPIRTGERTARRTCCASGAVSAMAQSPCQSGSSKSMQVLRKTASAAA